MSIQRQLVTDYRAAPNNCYGVFKYSATLNLTEQQIKDIFKHNYITYIHQTTGENEEQQDKNNRDRILVFARESNFISAAAMYRYEAIQLIMTNELFLFGNIGMLCSNKFSFDLYNWSGTAYRYSFRDQSQQFGNFQNGKLITGINFGQKWMRQTQMKIDNAEDSINSQYFWKGISKNDFGSLIPGQFYADPRHHEVYLQESQLKKTSTVCQNVVYSMMKTKQWYLQYCKFSTAILPSGQKYTGALLNGKIFRSVRAVGKNKIPFVNYLHISEDIQCYGLYLDNNLHFGVVIMSNGHKLKLSQFKSMMEYRYSKVKTVFGAVLFGSLNVTSPNIIIIIQQNASVIQEQCKKAKYVSIAINDLRLDQGTADYIMNFSIFRKGVKTHYSGLIEQFESHEDFEFTIE